ncbi:hypothetical protein CW711_06750 [Candidatus Bathyarchaeota archaeon]|nr:MAG: hypothetical protein CW711_06750 [Candidatus Bathyarchaeota archaeon]
MPFNISKSLLTSPRSISAKFTKNITAKYWAKRNGSLRITSGLCSATLLKVSKSSISRNSLTMRTPPFSL